MKEIFLASQVASFFAFFRKNSWCSNVTVAYGKGYKNKVLGLEIVAFWQFVILSHSQLLIVWLGILRFCFQDVLTRKSQQICFLISGLALHHLLQVSAEQIDETFYREIYVRICGKVLQCSEICTFLSHSCPKFSNVSSSQVCLFSR